MIATPKRRALRVAIGLACLGVAAALLSGSVSHAAASARSVSDERVQRSVAFLLAQQNTDGGFGEPGAASDPALTSWVTLALDAAGVEPGPLRRGGASLASYLLAQSPGEVTELELHVLARAASGLDASGPGARLRAEIRRGGRIGPRLNSTIWGIIALRAAKERVPKKVVRYLRRSQHASGGFSWAAGGPPDTNDTAAAIQALRAVGIARSAKPIRRAFRYLAASRRGSGGFPLTPGSAADAQSTGWVLQAYASTGRPGPAKSRRYLVRLQRADGRFVYRRGRALTPVWVTAQALPGLLQAAFPPGR